MSDYHHKRRRSRSCSYSRSIHKRISEQNRSKDYERHHHHHYSTQSNKQYNSHHQLDSNISINEILNHSEEYPPIVQSLVRELLVEQKKRLLIEERLNLSEHDNVILHNKYQQTIDNLTLLKHDFDKCRINLKNNLNQLNELHHSNCQLRLHIDQLLNNQRKQIYTDEKIFHLKRQRKY